MTGGPRGPAVIEQGWLVLDPVEVGVGTGGVTVGQEYSWIPREVRSSDEMTSSRPSARPTWP